jgi:hypothetical protein
LDRGACPRLAYFGGVARQTVGDNLKAGIHQGVLFTNRWSTGPMPTYYGTAIVAGREQARRRGGTGSRYRGFFPKSGRPCE